MKKVITPEIFVLQSFPKEGKLTIEGFNPGKIVLIICEWGYPIVSEEVLESYLNLKKSKDRRVRVYYWVKCEGFIGFRTMTVKDLYNELLREVIARNEEAP